ncbi:guanylate-binding protein 1-like isoform X2 [Ornithodoros turicata]|uniref:guanylate-binding protein 1-like isoform X2 n=1 Tax=Ornithodoros turicata TaxID=34597 RepID=UPI003139BBF2
MRKDAVCNAILVVISVYASISSSSNIHTDRPIQLVRPDFEHRRLLLIKENINRLAQVEGEIVTLAVVGKCHSGKSFLLNQLLGRAEGFRVGRTVKPETVGIWMWPQPMPIMQKTGRKAGLIFLDTEGHGASNVSENYHAKIFAITTLISSYLIYNSVKTIDQSEIDYLEFLARRTQLFALRSLLDRSKWKNPSFHDILAFPPLLWVVQDFVQSTLHNETATDWLRRLMRTTPRDYENYTISVLDMFPSTDCHTLFIPAVEPKLLADLSQAEDDQLAEEYIKERDEMCDKIKAKLSSNTSDGKRTNGPELATLLTHLVDVANGGSLSEVPGRWDAFVDIITTTATKDCTFFYETQMKSVLEEHGMVSDAKLLASHRDVMTRSGSILKQLLRGFSSALEKASEELKRNIEAINLKMRDENSRNVKVRCTSLTEKHMAAVHNYTQLLIYPMRGDELKQGLNSMVQENLEIFRGAIENLVPASDRDNYVTYLQLTDSTRLRNHLALEHLFTDVIDSALLFVLLVHEVNFSTSWNTSEPQTTAELKRNMDTGSEAASKVFEEKCSRFITEKQYRIYQASLKDKLRQETDQRRRTNELLVSKFIHDTKENVSATYYERTGDDILRMPMNTSQLYKLKAERRYAMESFDSTLRRFRDFDVYKAASKGLQVQLEAAAEHKKAQNLEKLKLMFFVPLSHAKQVIVSSAHNFSNACTLRIFMMGECLLHLRQEMPTFLQEEIKESIVEDYIDSEPELRNLIEEVDSFWSRLLCCLYRILWLVTLGLI